MVYFMKGPPSVPFIFIFACRSHSLKPPIPRPAEVIAAMSLSSMPDGILLNTFRNLYPPRTFTTPYRQIATTLDVDWAAVVRADQMLMNMVQANPSMWHIATVILNAYGRLAPPNIVLKKLGRNGHYPCFLAQLGSQDSAHPAKSTSVTSPSAKPASAKSASAESTSAKLT